MGAEPERNLLEKSQKIVMRAKEERLPESSEVVIDPPRQFARGSRPACPHQEARRGPRGLRPGYAANAGKVLMSSTRGLLRLPGTMSSNLSSLYLNERFEDGKPCLAVGCPLNPRTRVRVVASGAAWELRA